MMTKEHRITIQHKNYNLKEFNNKELSWAWEVRQNNTVLMAKKIKTSTTYNEPRY